MSASDFKWFLALAVGLPLAYIFGLMKGGPHQGELRQVQIRLSDACRAETESVIRDIDADEDEAHRAAAP